jgi:hypothetical protein
VPSLSFHDGSLFPLQQYGSGLESIVAGGLPNGPQPPASALRLEHPNIAVAATSANITARAILD